MKRDMALIRSILKYVEHEGRPDRELEPPELPNDSYQEISYHISFCVQAGYLGQAAHILVHSIGQDMRPWTQCATITPDRPSARHRADACPSQV
jgi:hypothetical protein